MANGLVIGALTTHAQYNYIGIVAAFTGDDNASATATLEYKETTSSTWLSAMPQNGTDVPGRLRRTDATSSGGPRFFNGALFRLNSNTLYDLRITFADADGVTGTNPLVTQVATTADNITPAASLTPHRYVNQASGSNANNGLTSGTAWKSLYYALNTAPAGSVVEFAPGYYSLQDQTINKQLILKAQYPALTYNTTTKEVEEANASNRTVFYYGDGWQWDIQAQRINVVGPSGASAGEQAAGVTAAKRWTAVDVVDGANTYRMWKLADVPGYFSQMENPVVAFYSDTLLGTPHRLPYWDLAGKPIVSPLSQATVNDTIKLVYTNGSYRYGFFFKDSALGNNAYDLYARLPGTSSIIATDQIDPNTKYVTFGNSRDPSDSHHAGTYGAGGRVTGVHFRGCAPIMQGSLGVLDYCLIEDSGVSIGQYGVTGVTDNVLDKCLIRASGISEASPQDGWAAPWDWVKGNLQNADGSFNGSATRIGAVNETNGVTLLACRRTLIRDCRIEGHFNGIYFGGGASTHYDDTTDTVWQNCRIRNISDDAIEPEAMVARVYGWDNTYENIPSIYSVAPFGIGPLVDVNARIWNMSIDRIARTPVNGLGLNVQSVYKLGGSNSISAVLALVNASVYGKTAGLLPDGSTPAGPAGPGGSSRGMIVSNGLATPFGHYIKNCIIHLAGRLMDLSGIPPNGWIEDYNEWGESWSANSDVRGMILGGTYSSSSVTGSGSLAAYRTGTGQGAHTNTLGTAHTDHNFVNTGAASIKSQWSAPDTNIAGLSLGGGSPLNNAGVVVPGIHAAGSTPDIGWDSSLFFVDVPGGGGVPDPPPSGGRLIVAVTRVAASGRVASGTRTAATTRAIV